MNILKKLFGNLNLDVNKLVDELHSSPVEKKELKIKLKEILTQAEGSAQLQVTRRWEADSKAGWLPANSINGCLFCLFRRTFNRENQKTII